ncbi:molybdenum ABC transporter ATP-binding protein [Subtercola boreus]|uniref:Molybdenum ABC transporter ATP-binding protein n=1 Tax=Subtercola boreus TaxID=120213 RepID=A0A3E0VF74_9MICO|nr:ABC transporter ATP-binding protein [Subtercola boreus]RFA08562.1 molybdenum ABC transporter ATP-binding protein [Subtercola boreus]TQL54504.1 molybdate transport system ATP-binding protein [Subtercola boreus]
MSLAFRATVAARGFDVSFSLAEGETLAILGPNGAGKSTLLNLIAGLLTPDSGEAVLGGEVLFRVPGGAGAPDRAPDDRPARRVLTPPHARSVALLAQEALLFPHLSVLNNVAFGPTSAGVKRSESLRTARRWLAEVDAAEFESRKPAQLSGGQAQRIAVARALAADPKLLLLDEPLAALDVAVAPAIRRMLRRVLEGRTAIIVTHDVLDAFTLADHVIVLDRGHVVESGPTRRVLQQPLDPFTADIAGLNVLSGIRTAHGMRTAAGDDLVLAEADDLPPGSACTVAIRPSSIRVTAEHPAGVPNTLALTLQDLEPRGDLVRVRAGDLSADVAPALAADLDLTPGAAVWFSFEPSAGALYATGS